MSDLEKPTYGTSKRALWMSGGAAWLAILVIVGAGAVWNSPGALALAPTVIPAMVMLIVALLGVHRGFGSLDMRTMAMARPPRLPSRTRSSHRARADPDEASGGEASP